MQAFLEGWDWMEKKAEFAIDVFPLDAPMIIVGRSVAVTHGTPECFPTIGALIEGFHRDDLPAKIPGRKDSPTEYGLCFGHVPEGELIHFTYFYGVEVPGPVDESRLPESTECFVIQPGHYARNRVSAPKDQAIGIAYTQFGPWEEASPEWECTDGIYEVYIEETPDWAVMELWKPVRKR